MPRLLQNLTIKEVSSVKRGAGRGVNVLLMKMASGDVDEIPLFLPPRGSTSVIDKLFDLSAEHDVPADKIAKARKALAQAIEGVDPNRDEAAQQAAIEKSLNQCLDYLTALVPVAKVEAFQAAVAAISKQEPTTMPIDAELQKQLDALNTGMTAANATIAKQAEELAIFKMKPEHQEYVSWLKSDGAAALDETAEKVTAFVTKFVAADEAGRDKVIKEFPPKKKGDPKKIDDADDPTAKAIAKALEDSPLLKGIVTENTELKKRLNEADARNAVADFAKKARDLGLPEAHGEVMRKAYSGDAEAQTAHEAMLKGITNQAATGIIFKEFGGGGGEGTGAMAYDLIKQKAEELRKTEAGKNLSSHQARAKVLEDPLNKELVDRHKSEERARQKAA